MNTAHKVMLSSAFVILILMGLLIVFGDKGLMDMSELKQGLNNMKDKNNQIRIENLMILKNIERLNTDDEYICSIARQELGMILPGEQIFRLNIQQNNKPDFE